MRKTAAVCVAKLHDINAQMVEDQGFLDSLRDLIADSNPMVCVRYFEPAAYFVGLSFYAKTIMETASNGLYICCLVFNITQWNKDKLKQLNSAIS